MFTTEESQVTLDSIISWLFSLEQNGLLSAERHSSEILGSGGGPVPVQSNGPEDDLHYPGVRALHGHAEWGFHPNAGADSVCLPVLLTRFSCSQPQHRYLRTH